jgi:hypothetical protein
VIVMTRRFIPLIAPAAFAAVWSCGSDAGADRAGVKNDAVDVSPAAHTVTTASLPSGCELIPVAEIERIVGPLEGQPKREGSGCRYFFPFDSSMPEWAKLREWERQVRASAGADTQDLQRFKPRRPELSVDIDVTGNALVTARGAAAVRERLSAEAGQASPAKAEPPAGWDEVSIPLGRGGFSGRVGHVTVTVALEHLQLPADSVREMAARVRDRIPDRPFAYPAAHPSASPPSGRDPCSVLTRAEAETVLGKLVVPPFRTHEGSPLADPGGSSCAYFTSGHRVLVLTPEWTFGKLSVNAERLVGDAIAQVANLPGPVADTLEGSWDEAALGASGDLILLKGSRSLTIGYLMSSTDAGGAIKLAGPALKRLASATEPVRPSVPDAGCLPTSRVSEILQMRFRLAGKLVNPDGTGTCAYQQEADPTVSLELSIKPGGAAQSVFEEVQTSAKMIAGTSAERIDIGEGGWAFQGKSQSRAAAVGQGKVYHARINDPLGDAAAGRKDAMLQLIARMME